MLKNTIITRLKATISDAYAQAGKAFARGDMSRTGLLLAVAANAETELLSWGVAPIVLPAI